MGEVAKQRTSRQNRALHKYYAMLAEELNNAGLDMRRTLKPSFEMRWTPYTVKEYMWRPLQKAMFGKESITELESQDIDKIFDVITKHLGEKFGLFVNFPSIESYIEERI